MGSVVVLSADAVTTLINNGVINGLINVNGELILEKPGGVLLNLGNIKSHTGLDNLSADDHPQYALADGSRGTFASEAQGIKADAARPNTQAVINIDGGDVNGTVETVTITDDGTGTGSWVNRFIGYFKPSAGSAARLVHFLNEYLELRLAPAKHNTVALRVFVRDTPTVQTNARDQSVPLVELMDDRTNRNSLWGLYDGGVQKLNGTTQVAYTLVLGPADPVPAGTPAGTVIVRTS